jgi:hypothetical protein
MTRTEAIETRTTMTEAREARLLRQGYQYSAWVFWTHTGDVDFIATYPTRAAAEADAVAWLTGPGGKRVRKVRIEFAGEPIATVRRAAKQAERRRRRC